MANIALGFSALLIFVTTAFGSTTTSMPQQQEKIAVTVYYESLCPDSKRFIFEQLKPAYSNLSNYMNLTLIPFGKSTYNRSEEGKYTFMCHHGESECQGNKVQACALKVLTKPEQQVSYIACLMSTATINNNTNVSTTYPTNSCASLIGIDGNPINNCGSNEEGDQLLAMYGDKTISFQNPLLHVPTIVFNNKFMAADSEMAQKDFKSVFCSKFTGKKPMECMMAAGPGNSAVTFYPGFIPIIVLFAITLFSQL